MGTTIAVAPSIRRTRTSLPTSSEGSPGITRAVQTSPASFTSPNQSIGSAPATGNGHSKGNKHSNGNGAASPKTTEAAAEAVAGD